MPSTPIRPCFLLTKGENFGQENFGESLVICQNFLPPKFCIIRYISDCSKLWLLNFYVTKCSVMHLGRYDKATYTLFNLATNSNALLHSTTEQKDLRVWITCTMNSSVHCHRVASKANQALGMIKRNFKHLSKCSLVTLYKIFVRQHLEYCAPVWNPHYCKDTHTLEKVQKRATKLVTSVSTLSYESRLSQLQLHSLYCRRQRSNLVKS